jgi:poly(hydroxyalkanoate) depolymerase family esterase
MRIVSSFLVLVATFASAEAALTPVSDFGSNPGALDMLEYVPNNLPSGRPLVVVLHGCAQQAAAMEAAGWNALADKYQFAVVYAQQRTANNQARCFTWFDAADIARGQGETQSIVQMVDTSIAMHGTDPGRVYVTGLSAGGAMTAVMLAAHPDRFRAGSIMAGIPYKCATDVASAGTCSNSGGKTPQQWGDLVRGAFNGFTGPYPRVQIWHGANDYTVPTAHATELVEQWTNVHGIDLTADRDAMVGNTQHTQYKSGDQALVELYLVNGMGHAVAIGADSLGACPATSGAFFSDQKICSTLRAAQFFGLLGSGGDPDGEGSGSNGSGSGEDDDDPPAGGCSAGNHGGATFAVIALIALWHRRRFTLG